MTQTTGQVIVPGTSGDPAHIHSDASANVAAIILPVLLLGMLAFCGWSIWSVTNSMGESRDIELPSSPSTLGSTFETDGESTVGYPMPPKASSGRKPKKPPSRASSSASRAREREQRRAKRESAKLMSSDAQSDTWGESQV
jgi:hypothetical protein